ncbi:MAG TPA: hypothetical protein ENH55_13170 [Aurantimonas coralicida]|nr:hypothetical protein [Aurantimonas coralicida]
MTTSVAVKAPVLLASTGNIPLASTGDIDGVTPSTGIRALFKDQTTDTENGIYSFNGSTWGREADFDGQRDSVRGTLVYVSTGLLNAEAWFVVTSTGVPGSTVAVTFARANFPVAVGAVASSVGSTLTNAGFTSLSSSSSTALTFEIAAPAIGVRKEIHIDTSASEISFGGTSTAIIFKGTAGGAGSTLFLSGVNLAGATITLRGMSTAQWANIGSTAVVTIG